MTVREPRPAHAGGHDFDGHCAPGGSGAAYFGGQATFSVGVFQWVPKSHSNGLKRGPVKVRVKGRCSDPELVYAKAREIASALDAGTYRGPKHVTV